MMDPMVVVDATVWVDFFGGVVNAHTTWLRSRVGQDRIAVVDLVLCEVLQGIRDDATFIRVRERLTILEILSAGDFAIQSATNYRLLRRRGITVRKTIDCMIATLCLMEGHSLLHRDRDFDPFEKHLGLRVIHPTSSVQ